MCENMLIYAVARQEDSAKMAESMNLSGESFRLQQPKAVGSKPTRFTLTEVALFLSRG